MVHIKFSNDESSDYIVSETAETEEPAEEETKEEVKTDFPAQDFEGSDDGVTVNVSAPEGALPEGTKMHVKSVSISNSDVEGAAGEGAGGLRVARAVDQPVRHHPGELHTEQVLGIQMSPRRMPCAD